MFDLITRLIETHQLIPVIAISGTFSWLTVCCCTFFIKRLFAESQRYQLISQMLQQGKPTEEILALVGGGRRQRKALGRLLNTNPSPACKTPTKSGAPPTTAVHTCVSDSSAAATPQRAHPLSTAFGYLQVPLGLLSKLAFASACCLDSSNPRPGHSLESLQAPDEPRPAPEQQLPAAARTVAG